LRARITTIEETPMGKHVLGVKTHILYLNVSWKKGWFHDRAAYPYFIPVV
jgi:hypothetical protein